MYIYFITKLHTGFKDSQMKTLYTTTATAIIGTDAMGMGGDIAVDCRMESSGLML